MAKGMNWNRAKARRPSEAAAGEGMVRKNGEVTPILPKDQLAQRAAKIERAWLRRLGLVSDSKGRIVERRQRRFR